MADEYFDFDDEGAVPKKRDNLFVWTVFILLLIGIACACWMGSFYVFGHPEQPRAYALLKKLKKIEPPKRFEETAAPPGEFLSSQRLFERYSSFSPLQLERENAELLRTFVTNYRETKKLVPYVRGNFTIAGVVPLAGKDFIEQGVVAIAQSNDFPRVLIEHLYPTSAEELAGAQRVLTVGSPIKLEKTYDLAAVIHIAKGAQGRMQFTVVPLLYGGYALSGGVGTFKTEPPPALNLSPGLPVLKEARVEEALQVYAGVRRNQPVPEFPVAGESAPLPKGPEIVRLDALPEGVEVPKTGALPEMPIATPIPNPLAGRGAPTPRKPPIEVAALTTPKPIPVATPLIGGSRPPPLNVSSSPPTIAMATPAPNVPPGVIRPFNPQPGLPGAEGNQWRTYKPGAAPSGRIFGPGDTAAFGDGGPVPERNYLRGNFVVTASGGPRAVMRPLLANGSSDLNVRVVVDYPNGSVPPPEGGALERDDAHPYQIYEVRRERSGEVTMFVREIIQQ